jgi:hypothetical protein
MENTLLSRKTECHACIGAEKQFLAERVKKPLKNNYTFGLRAQQAPHCAHATKDACGLWITAIDYEKTT